MKTLLKIVLVLVALVIVAGVVLFIYIDSIARKAIEEGGTYALGVPTTLQKADVGVFSGEFAMSGLKVANPEGFDTPHLLDLGDGGVSVTFGSLREEIVELPHLTLSNLDVHLQRKDSGTNYDVVLENLKKLDSGEKKPDEEGTRFIVRTIDIRNVTVHVDLIPAGGDLTKINIPVDQIQLNDVGSDTGKGVLLADLAGVIFKAIFAAIVDKGGSLLPTDMLNDLTGQLAQLTSLEDLGVNVLAGMGGSMESVTEVLGDLTDVAGEAGEGVKDAVDDAIGDIQDKAGDALGGLGDLLGGDDDKD